MLLPRAGDSLVGVLSSVSAMPVKKHFQSGESVPNTAVYAAVHDGHRVTHHVTLREGEVFPQCEQCRDRVRFEFVAGGSLLDDDQTTKQSK